MNQFDTMNSILMHKKKKNHNSNDITATMAREEGYDIKTVSVKYFLKVFL